ncbi:MAG: ATP-binding cassette domain-containing protein [Bacteroidetes bacterium]|nr:MAG: ATP-binding cassette domain-containing protein [Bacteroidota bacterium]
MIEVSNLCKEFSLNKKQMQEIGVKEKSLKVLHDVSFTCQPGRVYSLLGPNGAGKTTTLRIIATILRATSGTVKVGGINLNEDPSAARAKMGFLTGTTGLYERLTPNEMVKYFGKLNGMDDKLIEDRKDRLYSLLGMHDFANKRIGKLSTGMKQKVSITRTMIHDPEVVVFDEPTSGLDVITAKNIIELIRDCKDQGKTVIFSSHIMSEVDLLCDDLGIIHDGRILFNDTMENFRKQMQTENLTEEFIHIVTQNEPV